MSIKFVCTCGKHLRARDEMAARRSVCPACGAPVGIPSLRPTHSGTPAGPLSPTERQRTRRCVPPAEVSSSKTHAVEAGSVSDRPESRRQLDVPPASGSDQVQHPPLDPGLVRLVVTPKPRTRWSRRQLEAHWYECLSYPFRAWPLVLGLGAALTILGALALLVLTGEFEFPAEPLGQWLLYSGFALVALPSVVYACGLLDCVLTSARAGELKQIRWPERRADLVFKSGITWLACFLAGPILLGGACFFYWVHGGDLAPLDWLILAELLIAAVGYSLFVLLSVNQKGSLTGANPVRVLALMSRLGYRTAIASLGATALVALHGWWLIIALVELRRNVAVGVLLFPICWISGMFWAIFLLRLLGIWCYRARV